MLSQIQVMMQGKRGSDLGDRHQPSIAGGIAKAATAAGAEIRTHLAGATR